MGQMLVSGMRPSALPSARMARAHVRARGHVLRGQGAAGEGLVRVQGLPAAFELVAVAVLAEIFPDVLDGHVCWRA